MAPASIASTKAMGASSTRFGRHRQRGPDAGTDHGKHVVSTCDGMEKPLQEAMRVAGHSRMG